MNYQSKGQNHHFSDYKGFSIQIDEYFKKNNIDILVNNTQGPPPGRATEKLTIKLLSIYLNLLYIQMY